MLLNLIDDFPRFHPRMKRKISILMAVSDIEKYCLRNETVTKNYFDCFIVNSIY